MTLSIMALHVGAVMLRAVMLRAVMLSAVIYYYAISCYSQCPYAGCRGSFWIINFVYHFYIAFWIIMTLTVSPKSFPHLFNYHTQHSRWTFYRLHHFQIISHTPTTAIKNSEHIQRLPRDLKCWPIQKVLRRLQF